MSINVIGSVTGALVEEYLPKDSPVIAIETGAVGKQPSRAIILLAPSGKGPREYT